MSDDGAVSNAGQGADPAGSGQTPSKTSADHSCTDATTSTKTQPDYELLRLIGRGSYGEVWLARDQAGTYRAVKVIFRESFERERPYEREYEGICKFEPVSRSYDNQVQILHVGRHDEKGQFYYIMELADDQRTGRQIDPNRYEPKTIKSELKKLGRFPVKDCLRIGAALAVALENLHQHGLIHRDIKPANIIFVNGVPKLADIGLVTDRDVSVSYVGTEGYIPPEGPSSAQADIYGLGKVLYEMSTGRDRLDYPELPTDLEERPDRKTLLELNRIVARACDRDPRKRYRTARHMLADLARAQRGESVRRSRGRGRWLVLMGKVSSILPLLGAIVFSALYFGRPSAGRPNALKLFGSVHTNSVGAPMVYIPPGKFLMGSPPDEVDRRSDEGPQTQVTLSRDFWLGRYEVTQSEYEVVVGTNPSFFKGTPKNPVEGVGWAEAVSYCAKLTERERQAGRLPKGWAYRLPTEAEWEYAARAGTTTRFNYGDDPGYLNLRQYAWFYTGDTNVRRAVTSGPRPVGGKLPNPWGLYDMYGNVYEWCLDYYTNSYPGGNVTDPQGPVSGTRHVVRGGRFYWYPPTSGAQNCRSAARLNYAPNAPVWGLGLRVALAASPQ
jgi:formylglycine-generating enzyme required for sulfatase activity